MITVAAEERLIARSPGPVTPRIGVAPVVGSSPTRPTSHGCHLERGTYRVTAERLLGWILALAWGKLGAWGRL